MSSTWGAISLVPGVEVPEAKVQGRIIGETVSVSCADHEQVHASGASLQIVSSDEAKRSRILPAVHAAFDPCDFSLLECYLRTVGQGW